MSDEDSGQGSMPGEGPDPSIEALSDLLQLEPKERLTRGTPKRTKAMALLHAYADDFDLPEYGELAERLADAWAGEDGWGMDRLIRALSASKAVTNIQAGQGDGEK